ncbi:caspase-8-like isoform X2 [Leptopilina boulardi]|uniref:caspase-8-like isoform X2 n=1 Tax=Leptopilina boulardi TaxID=63433 RepID=UPI0021F5A4B9|nr:caspase-8-like isoform X2 [Leptopilina boulardi]
MSLETDAISCSQMANMSKDKINFTIFPTIENNLDRQEKISIMFLSTSEKNLLQAYKIITDLLEKYENNVLYQWFSMDINKENWEEKLLESLLLIKNFQVIRELGFTGSEEELFRKQFQINEREVSPNLNRVLKSLYFLCDDLSDEETKKLVSQFEGIDIHHEELELYLLHWIQINCITVSESSGNLKTLLQHLKKMHFDIDSKTYLSLENWNEREKRNEISKIPRNMQDALQSLDNSLPMDDSFTETRVNKVVQNKDEIYDFKKGLCFIINEEKFDTRWGKREGSQKDVEKLKETFEKFGYDIIVEKNLTEKEIREKLKSLSNYTKKNYDCIVLCILSHGEKRTIVTKDGKSLSLDDIRNLICTMQLKNVVKIVLVQACQGEYLGHDTTDGPSSEEILSVSDSPYKQSTHKLMNNIQFADLAMFVATIKNFKSIRNTGQGSWFIQTLCKVLEDEERITWKKLSLKVKNIVSNQRGEVCEGKMRYPNITQIPEIVEDSLTKDFIFQKDCQVKCIITDHYPSPVLLLSSKCREFNGVLFCKYWSLLNYFIL